MTYAADPKNTRAARAARAAKATNLRLARETLARLTEECPSDRERLVREVAVEFDVTEAELA